MPVEGARNAAIVWVVIALVVLVAALLAIDWSTAGPSRRRMLVRAKDQSSDNAGVGYASIPRQAQSTQSRSNTHI
jgi:hypothetical protein